MEKNIRFSEEGSYDASAGFVLVVVWISMLVDEVLAMRYKVVRHGLS